MDPPTLMPPCILSIHSWDVNGYVLFQVDFHEVKDWLHFVYLPSEIPSHELPDILDEMSWIPLVLVSIDDPAYLSMELGRGSGLQLSPTKDLKSVNWGALRSSELAYHVRWV